MTKAEYKKSFMALYGLTEADLDRLWWAFMNFGMNSGSDVHSHSTKAHYFFSRDM